MNRPLTRQTVASGCQNLQGCRVSPSVKLIRHSRLGHNRCGSRILIEASCAWHLNVGRHLGATYLILLLSPQQHRGSMHKYTRYAPLLISETDTEFDADYSSQPDRRVRVLLHIISMVSSRQANLGHLPPNPLTPFAVTSSPGLKTASSIWPCPGGDASSRKEGSLKGNRSPGASSLTYV